MKSGDSERDGRDPLFKNLALASVTGLVGCLTLVIIFIAVMAGLWLDGHFQTKPMITLTLVIGSIPLSLIVMFIVVRRVASRTITEANGTEKGRKMLQEEEETNFD